MHKFFNVSHPTKRYIKPKPSIEKITLASESSLPLDIMQSMTNIHQSKVQKQKKKVSYCCCIFGKISTYIAKYKLENVALIEKYCDVCIVKIV